jgi:phosphoribosylformimino-5-aminoimidazole carboxamide ribotide isomerase
MSSIWTARSRASRTIEAIKELIESGVGQVILGTVAVTEPVIFARAMEMFDDRIVVGLDGSHNNIAVEGWTKETDEDIIATGHRLADMGVHRVIYTDISRDGTQMGPNIEATRALAQAIGIPVTASGGVASLTDIHALKALEVDGVEGVIVGKALYEHNFKLREAIEAAG